MKQVIVVRADLEMSAGKLAAQACHASVTAVFHATEESIRHWMSEGQTKVVLEAASAEVLLTLREKAAELDLPAVLIRDAGRTELDPGTVTALGLGPGPEELIDQVTGHLRLLR